MSTVKTPFSDAIGEKSVPKTASKGGKYDAAPMSGVPGRDGTGITKELTYDTSTTSKSPSTSGAVKTLFKDAVS